MATHMHKEFRSGGIIYTADSDMAGSAVRAWEGSQFGGRVLHSTREGKWSAGTGWKYATRDEACAAAQESRLAWYRHLIAEVAAFEVDAIVRGLDLPSLRGEA